MAVYAVTYTYTDDSAGRDQHRPGHREFLAGLPELLVSGPYGPDDAPGALLLFSAASKQDVLALTEKDPFRTEGLVAEVGVVEWLPVLGPLTEAFRTA